MLSRKRIEELDASGRIYRKPMSSMCLPIKRFWMLTRDVNTGILLIVFGFINAALILISGFLLGISGSLWLAALAFAALAALASLFDAYALVFPYYQFWAKTSHGSARWAALEDLKLPTGFCGKIGEPVPDGALESGEFLAIMI